MKKIISNHIHEDFDIKDDILDERIKLLRQERYFSESESCYLSIKGENYQVINYSSFGVAIICDPTKDFDDELVDIPFIFNKINIVKLNLQKIRTENHSDGNIIIAYDIISDPINLDKLNAVNAANRVIQLQQTFAELTNHIPHEIKAQVYEIVDWLENLMSEVDKVEEDISAADNQSIIEYEETIIGIIAEYLGKVFPPVYNRYADTLSTYPEEIHKDSIDFLRQKLNHIIYQSPFADRVFNKPRGYAGDYEMMNLIYKQENLGKSLFAQCLHRYYINEPAAQAVRNRSEYLVNVITKSLKSAPKDRAYRILSVACGPAMEWQKLIPELTQIGQEIVVDLLDQDKQALLSTQNQLRKLCRKYSLTFPFQFINKAIKNIIVNGTEYKNYDLIYSAGLFDYLTDPVAVMTAKKMFESLRPGGKMIIGNFNVDNPNQVGMDYALDWKLIYRSEKDLLKLFSDIGSKLDVEKERLDINLFCVIHKNS